MTTYGEIRVWRAGLLDETATGLARRRDELVELSDELAAARPPKTWSGEVAQAARRSAARLIDRLEHLVAEVAAVRSATADAAQSVRALQGLVNEADHLAWSHHFSINDDGSVTDHAGEFGSAGPGPLGLPERLAALSRIGELVGIITARAAEIDHLFVAVLDRAIRGEIGDGGATSLADAAKHGDQFGDRGLHDELLRRYRVSVDPDGMVEFPTGVLGWSLERLGHSRQEVTAGEARLLEDIGLFGIKDAYDIYKTALNSAENVFAGQGLTDGHSDAFRHAYWNAMLTNRFGEGWTEQYTTAHERGGTNTATAEAMDLHNNEIGRRIAAAHPDAGPDELAQLIEQAVQDGDLVVVGPDGQLVRSNEIAIGDNGMATGPPSEGGADPPAPDPYQDNTSGGYNPGSDGDNYGTYDN
ncbi:DUF6973 domain-containing protein [Solwaraspora sp. WMMB335]|uniref:DUF6973 domain-containing protein n=1 Tax=Solwaraspora sp. WMMB335 TaxID=3404118 RepID=UPI003B932AE1